MYPIDAKTLRQLPAGRWQGVGRNVCFLGLTSLLTDLSSEMVTSILPIYLMAAVGLTPLQFGFVDGLSHAAAALAKVSTAWLADRWQRHRALAAAGYGLSAGCKLLLLAAGTSWGLIAAAVALDRVGKGIRTSPRDALITLSSAPQHLGLAFGVHRALDTVGALLGPLVAFGILALLPQAYDLVFVTSFCVAVVGLATLLCFVRPVSAGGPGESVESGRPADVFMRAEALQSLRNPRFAALVLVGSGLGLVTVADSFFFLILQRKLVMPVSAFPLLYGATALAYLLLAIPAGRAGDRFGRGRVFVFGHALLLAALAVLMAGDSLALGVLSLSLLGAYYACTDGVMMAIASGLLPRRLLATGLALLATATGLARWAASVSFGALWGWQGPAWALGCFAAALAAVLLPAAWWMSRWRACT